MKYSTQLLSALCGVFFCLISQLEAQNGLTRTTAAKLIAEAEQVRLDEVAVGPMQQVEERLKNGAVATRGICVTFISTKVVNSRRRRVVSSRTFYFDPEWGWYSYALETVRGGDRIDVVSENAGRFEIR